MFVFNRKGIAFVEVLVVVVAIATLAAISLRFPHFRETQREHYVTAMKSSLSEVADSATHWFDTHGGTYTGFTRPSVSNDNVLIEVQSTTSGWAAQASHAEVPYYVGILCEIGGGTLTPSGLGQGVPGGSDCG